MRRIVPDSLLSLCPFPYQRTTRQRKQKEEPITYSNLWGVWAVVLKFVQDAQNVREHKIDGRHKNGRHKKTGEELKRLDVTEARRSCHYLQTLSLLAKDRREVRVQGVLYHGKPCMTCHDTKSR
jgi:hypothetical protein